MVLPYRPRNFGWRFSHPQQYVEAIEEKVQAQKAAGRAMRIAVKRWGRSGQRMLEALAEMVKPPRKRPKPPGLVPPP